MDFRTLIPIQKTDFPIDYNSRILLLGSCFAENMADKFEYFKFQNTVNPFGIIFNPVSIERNIRRVVNKEFFTEKDIFFHNDLWHCFEVHSDLSNPDKDAFLENLNQLILTIHSQIATQTHVIITLGTAWVYRNNENGEIVANCHKVPQKQFSKELLSAERIQQSLEAVVSMIASINPKAKFIFTVSPVRHSKDGFVQNQQSKSHLIMALHKSLGSSICNLQCEYFPSYEIMMDELRDYRFYAEDMLHPNQTAIDYIWIKFFENFVSESEFSTMQQVCDIQKALHHRPFNPDSASHQKFLKSLQLKIDNISIKHSFMNF